MPSKMIHMKNGRWRRMDYKAPMMVDIVDPTIRRGTPPRDITMADIISVPVKRSGTWNLGDMLSFDAIRNLWIADNIAKG